MKKALASQLEIMWELGIYSIMYGLENNKVEGANNLKLFYSIIY